MADEEPTGGRMWNDTQKKSRVPWLSGLVPVWFHIRVWHCNSLWSSFRVRTGEVQACWSSWICLWHKPWYPPELIQMTFFEWGCSPLRSRCTSCKYFLSLLCHLRLRGNLGLECLEPSLIGLPITMVLGQRQPYLYALVPSWLVYYNAFTLHRVALKNDTVTIICGF